MENKCSRPDLSNLLIHLTKGTDDEDAFGKLKSIIRDKRLKQSLWKKGGKNIVCFTETPLDCIKTAGGFVNYTNYHKYSQFGIMVYKKDVYLSGGRPVLYLENKYENKLPEEIRWRHQVFEPDFQTVKNEWTWEREWRLISDFCLEGKYFETIVPTIEFAERLKKELLKEQISIYEECHNDQIGNLIYDELCNPIDRLEFQSSCPLLEEFDKKVICIDGSC